MGKKFCLSTKTPAAEAPAFNALESYAAVVESFNALNDSIESLSAVEAEAIQIETIRDSAREAMEAFQACGVTADMLGIYNRGGRLDAELGLEALDVSKATAEMLEARKQEYVSKLGESVASCEGAIVEWFKKFLNAILDFFKKFFHMDAQIIKTLDGLKETIEKPSNPDATMKGLSQKSLKTVCAALKGIDALCNELKTKISGDGADPDEIDSLITKKINPSITAMGLTWENGKISGDFKDEFKESEGTVKDKGFTGGAKAELAQVKGYLDSSGIKALSKQLVDITKKCAAAAKDGDEAATRTRDVVIKANAFIKFHAKLTRMAAITLLSLGRTGGVAKKEEKPAEGAEKK